MNPFAALEQAKNLAQHNSSEVKVDCSQDVEYSKVMEPLQNKYVQKTPKQLYSLKYIRQVEEEKERKRMAHKWKE